MRSRDEIRPIGVKATQCERLARRGFTVVELMVCLSILGVLTALLIPAVQAAREVARRASCGNNLRQIGLALSGYEAVYSTFPYMNVGFSVANGDTYVGYGCFSTHVALLPYLDQTVLFSSVNFSRPGAAEVALEGKSGISLANSTVARTELAVLLCPSGESPRPTDWAGTDYRANIGTAGKYLGPLSAPHEGYDGAFVPLETIRAADFRDGLSQTAAFAEKSRGHSTQEFDRFTGYWINPILYTTQDELVATCRSLKGPPKAFQGDTGNCWFLPFCRYTFYKHDTGPNSSVPDCVGGWNNSDPAFFNGAFASRSGHPGGVHVMFADGHVKFLGDAVEIRVWRAFGTRAGGELTTAID